MSINTTNSTKTQKTSREENVKRFYGVETAESVADSISSNKVFILLNTLLILTGAVVSIALNITNLESIKSQQNMLRIIQDDVNSKFEMLSKLDQIVKGDIKPKVTLINSAVSVSIPSQISNLQTKFAQQFNTIEELVEKQCTCNPLSGIFPTSSPSKPPKPEDEPDNDQSDDDKVDTTIKPLNYSQPPTCNKTDTIVHMEPGQNMYAVPNIGPAASSDDECYTNPSFSIGSSIYMFAQEIRKTDCSAGEILSIQVVLGRIVDKGQQGPQASPLLVWSVPNPKIINSCAVVAGDEMGWVLCSVTLTAESGEPVPHMFDGFWLYKFEPDTEVVAYRIAGYAYLLDRVYDSVYIGKGGGIQEGDSLYFQMFGVSRNRQKFTALCEYGTCIGTGGGGYQTLCNSAVTLLGNEEALITNAFLRVGEIYSGKPIVVTQTFPISDTYRGSNGRIYSIGSNYGIYLAPSSWNRYLRFGTTPDLSVKTVSWLDARYPIMSILSTCTNNAYDMCPQICGTRGYQDIFPLSSDAEYYTYVSISPMKEGTKSAVVVRNMDGSSAATNYMITYYRVNTATISCFQYKREPWCIVVSEAQKTKNSLRRIYAHSYKIKHVCEAPYKIGTTAIPIYTNTSRV